MTLCIIQPYKSQGQNKDYILRCTKQMSNGFCSHYRCRKDTTRFNFLHQRVQISGGSQLSYRRTENELLKINYAHWHIVQDNPRGPLCQKHHSHPHVALRRPCQTENLSNRPSLKCLQSPRSLLPHHELSLQ